MSLKAILEKLPSSGFIRVHRSYVVQRKKVDRVEGKNIIIANTKVPIGVRYEEQIQRELNR